VFAFHDTIAATDAESDGPSKKPTPARIRRVLGSRAIDALQPNHCVRHYRPVDCPERERRGAGGAGGGDAAGRRRRRLSNCPPCMARARTATVSNVAYRTPVNCMHST